MFKVNLFRKTGFAWVMLGVGLLVTADISFQVKQSIEQAAVKQFAFNCDQVTLKIQERLGTYEEILRGGHALFAASQAVERKEWQAYVEALRAERSIPGMQGLGFAQVIPADQLAAHIARIRSEGFPDYTVKPPGERTIYTSIIYLEPFRDRNLRAFGYDMYTEPVRRAAMEQARDSSDAVLSGKVELMQETDTDVQVGVLMYVPVYRNGAPVDTVEQRRAALVGWVYSPYRMNDLMTGILAGWAKHENKTVDLAIYDGLQATPGSLLFDSQPAFVHDVHLPFYLQRTIDFNGHQWLLIFDYTSTLSGISYTPAWAALIGGLVFSGLLFGLMRSLINTQANATLIADKLTEERRLHEKLLKESDVFKFAILNSLPAEVAVVNRDGTILVVNESWWCFALENGIDPFKKSQTSTADGANYLALCRVGTDLIVSADTWEASSGVQAVLDGSLPCFSMEYLRATPTQQQWILMTVLPLELGISRAAVISHTDITERKTAEVAIAESRNLLMTVINAIPIRVFWKDCNLRYLGCNMAFAKDAGMTHPQDVIGKDDFQLGWADQAELYRADDCAVMESGIARLAYDELQTTPDGQTIWLRLSKVPLSNQGNEVFGLLGIYEDITQHKRLEDEREEALNRLRKIADQVPGVVYQYHLRTDDSSCFPFARRLSENRTLERVAYNWIGEI
jgi:PAS domain S-box-containing protein